jgi:hypothetical protein
MRDSDIKAERIRTEIRLLYQNLCDRSNETKILHPEGSAFQKSCKIIKSLYEKLTALH